MRTNGYKGQPWYQYVPSGEFHLAMGDHWRRHRLAGSLRRMNLECSQYLSVGLSQRQSHTWTLASARFARCPHPIGMMRWAMRLVILMTIASVGDISLSMCVSSNSDFCFVSRQRVSLVSKSIGWRRQTRSAPHSSKYSATLIARSRVLGSRHHPQWSDRYEGTPFR